VRLKQLRQQAPLLIPLTSLALGILIGHWVRFFALELSASLTLLFALTLLAWQRSPRLFLPCSVFIVLFTGIALETIHRPGSPPEIDAGARETVLLSGCIIEPPAFYEGRDQFVVELAPKARARVSLIVRDGEAPPSLHYGQRVEFEAHIRPIRNFHNPGAFDFERYEARSGIYWSASGPASSLVTQSGSCGSRWMASFFQIRTAALDRLETFYPNNPYARGMLEATLIGETRKLERIWTDHFRRSGTYHMLVIDGLHITILASFFLFLLRLCRLPELPALAVTAAGAWFYAMISGMNAPAVRAAGGFTLYVACRFVYRRRKLLNLLAAVAIVYLIYDPDQLFDPGFQLSFLAVAAIAALAIPILDASSTPYNHGLTGVSEPSRDPRLPPRVAQFRLELRLLAEAVHYYLRLPQRWILESLAFAARLIYFAWDIAVISIVIQISLSVPMAIYFHRLSLSGLSANIIVVPLLGLVVPVGFVAIFTGWQLPATFAAWLLAAGEKVANWHLRFEPNWRIPSPPVWLSLAFCASLVILAFALRRSRTWGVTATSLSLSLFALIFWHPFAPQIERGVLEMTAIDVGQGDSLLVSFPDGKLMLVDGGGFLSYGRPTRSKLDVGEDVVSPYLWNRSIRKVDVVALTHAHDDHAGGLPALIENFHPSELWTGATAPSGAWSAVEGKAREGKVKITAMTAGRSFNFGGAQVEVISPPADYDPGDAPKNNDSLVLRISYGRRSFLLTGDMEKLMELRAVGDDRPLRADVLKVGHHGSNTSSTQPFLDAVQPVFAVISDGFENSFHHPHPQVLSRLAGNRATTLRTDIRGLITIRTDGRQISVETFR